MTLSDVSRTLPIDCGGSEILRIGKWFFGGFRPPDNQPDVPPRTSDAPFRRTDAKYHEIIESSLLIYEAETNLFREINLRDPNLRLLLGHISLLRSLTSFFTPEKMEHETARLDEDSETDGWRDYDRGSSELSPSSDSDNSSNSSDYEDILCELGILPEGLDSAATWKQL